MICDDVQVVFVPKTFARPSNMCFGIAICCVGFGAHLQARCRQAASNIKHELGDYECFLKCLAW
jgi:hypothetical protein